MRLAERVEILAVGGRTTCRQRQGRGAVRRGCPPPAPRRARWDGAACAGWRPPRQPSPRRNRPPTW